MRRSTFLGLIPLALATITCGSEESSEDPGLLINRIWFEKAPKLPTDHIHALFLLPRPKRGAFSNSSAYDLHLEIFEYTRDGAKVGLTFPQSGKQTDLKYTISKCDEDPFDLCLDLEENPWGGPKRYYGIRANELQGELGERAARIKGPLGE